MNPADSTAVVVTTPEDGGIAFVAVYPNRYRQTRRRRVWNWIRRSGSTAEWIETDFDVIRSALAAQYGIPL